MIWTTEIRAGLIVVIARLLGLAVTAVNWRGDPQPAIVGVSATIDEIGESGIGVDEITYTEGPTEEEPTETTPTVYGLREASIQVSVWSPSQKLEESARVYTSRLRTRLHWPSATEELRALGLGLVDVSDSIPIDVEQSSRLRSGAAVDVRLGFGVAEADAAIPFIEHVYVTSIATEDGDPTITNAGGTPLPLPGQAAAWVPPLPPDPEP